MTQATISDIERGRVQVCAVQLKSFAEILKKPIPYFFLPGSNEVDSERETELLVLFRSVPDRWQQRILNEVKIQAQLQKRVQPYEDAGIPEEFFEHLLYEEMEKWELEEIAATADLEEPTDYLTFRQRYEAWKTETEQNLNQTDQAE